MTMRKQCDSDRSCRSPHHQQANFVESTSSLSSGHPAPRWTLPGIQGVILTDRKYEISRKLYRFFGTVSTNNFRVRWQVYKQYLLPMPATDNPLTSTIRQSDH
jgi:hypothetical protein